MTPDHERTRHEGIWQALLSRAPDCNATTEQLEELGIRPAKTGQGIFRDHNNTSGLAPEGVTLTLLDTGTTYADAFDDDAGEYHYPSTKRGGKRDENEVEATKHAGRLDLPVFVILCGASQSTREVRRGWIESWDDSRRVFLISFRQPKPRAEPVPFSLATGRRVRRTASVACRSGQARFRFQVLSRYGGACVLCGLDVDLLLEAAHICGVEDGGTDDPRNGIVLCRNHHRAFDAPALLVGIEPSTLQVVVRAGLSLASMQITRPVLARHSAPHIEALAWAWERFRRSTGGSL